MTSIPHLFRCPISLDLFTDPVTLSTGQTYDRRSIEKWLAAGNLTCPVTMQRLHDPTLVPNHTLRHLIDQWLLSGTEPNPNENPSSPQINTNESSLATLKRNLQVKGSVLESSSSSRMEIFRRIRMVSMESDTGRQCLIQLGFFPLLLDLLFHSPQVREPEVMEVALDCVLSLSPSTQLDSLNILKEKSNLSAMVDHLNHKNTSIKTGLCCLIEVATTTEDLCFEIGRQNLIFRTLVTLLSSHTTESEASVRALSGLCSFEPNRPIAIGEGAVDGLITYLSAQCRQNVARALATVEALVGTEAGRKAVVRNPAGVRVLVKMVFRVSAKDDGGSEHAVGALLVVCGGGKAARAEAVNVGVLSQLLLLLQSQCGSKAKADARALLKLLSSMWGEEK